MTAINWPVLPGTTKLEAWNPVTGCTAASEGCVNCWARALHFRRQAANVKKAMIYIGLKDEGERHIRASEGWSEYADRVGEPEEGWAVRARKLGVRLPCPPQYDLPFSQVQVLPERLDKPLHWRQPRTVLVGLLGDLFHDDVTDEFLEDIFQTMYDATWHTFMLLTKRPERLREWKMWVHPYIEAGDPGHIAEPRWPSNVWLGVTAENQARADERIPILLDTPAAHRFVSCEPLLEGIDIRPQHCTCACGCRKIGILDTKLWFCASCFINWCHRSMGQGGLRCEPRKLDLMIVGGESGSHARPCNLDWIRGIVRQCQAASGPVWVKQLGAHPVGWGYHQEPVRDYAHRYMDCWPADLRVRQTPGVRA